MYINNFLRGEERYPMGNIEGELKIIPFYTGRTTLEDILSSSRDREILWLEILFNGSIDWEHFTHPFIKESYEKACIWYWNFKSLVDAFVKREPLGKREGKPDLRELRRFLEAINFVRA